MVIVEHFTNGGWADSCRHTLEADTVRVDQLGLSFSDGAGETSHYDVGRCSKCGEFVTLERAGAGLFDSFGAGDGEGVTS